MKFCTKCGNQMEDDMIFCKKCGTKDLSSGSTVKNEAVENSEQIHTTSFEDNKAEAFKLRTSMKIWMIVSFIFTGIFAIFSIADASMLALVCFFGIFGLMFLALAKEKKGCVRLFQNSKYLNKTNGISKGAFVGISIFLAFFLFISIINAFDTGTSDNKTQSNTAAVITEEVKEEASAKPTPEIPSEFADECPISVSVSLYDNILDLPELKCNIKNNTDKEISAIQFYFSPKDVYGEEIDSIFTQNNLQFDTAVPAKASNSAQWQLLDQSIKSGDFYVYSVYYSDGTEWGDRNAATSKIKKYATKIQVNY